MYVLGCDLDTMSEQYFCIILHHFYNTECENIIGQGSTIIIEYNAVISNSDYYI